MGATLPSDPDRLFPALPAVRDTARGLYERVAALPILSPHGHVPVRLLHDDSEFTNAAELFVTHDHYVFRLLHAAGVGLADLGLDPASPVDPRAAWRLLCAHWHLFAGTATGYWLTDELTRLFDVDTQPSDDYAGYLRAIDGRRAHFISRGAVSADHGVPDAFTVDLDSGDAAALYRRAVRGDLDAAGSRAFRGHMLLQMARMSVADGLVMTLHPGILRNHHTPTSAQFGPDTGHDLPVRTEFVQSLRPLLERYGTAKGFHLVLFTTDESTYSREIAPLAGFYPSVYVGAPWWFLDAPDAALRFRSAVTETAGFYRYSGFVDDTRAFLSIPARHDMARRLDAAFLARLVHEGRMTLAVAERLIVDVTDRLPREVFKL